MSDSIDVESATKESGTFRTTFSKTEEEPKIRHEEPRDSKTNMVPFETFSLHKNEDHDESSKGWQKFREWFPWYKAIEMFLFMGAIILFVIAGIDMIEIYGLVEDTLEPNPGNGSMICNLIGDSLFNKPYHMFDLPHKMNYFVNYQFTINDYAINGQVIHNIIQTLPPAIYDPTPDVVLLFWDSDISNYDEYVMTVDEIYQKRMYYAENLTYVINTTLAAGVKYMAVGGPGFLGEGYLLKKHYFWHKVDQLNDYRIINEEVTRNMNVTYVNVRHKYLMGLPWYWPYFMWYITIDGEHENARGTRFVSELFGKEMKSWLQGYNASMLE